MNDSATDTKNATDRLRTLMPADAVERIVSALPDWQIESVAKIAEAMHRGVLTNAAVEHAIDRLSVVDPGEALREILLEVSACNVGRSGQ